VTEVRYQEPYAPSTRGDHWGTLNAARRAMGLGPHRGMDWAPGDVPALAIADGVVAGKWALSSSRVLGNVLVLKHADGLFSGSCHLASLPSLKIGTEVARHHSIGANLGSTGSAASGRHLHLTLSRTLEGVFQGVTIDPLAWILAHDDAPPAKTVSGRKTTTARAGEGLYAIAERTGVAYAKLVKLNPGIKPSDLELGQRIYLS
jgi:murein DD-endopeptidase MepM/ murein hydrolase activator NlpD